MSITYRRLFPGLLLAALAGLAQAQQADSPVARSSIPGGVTTVPEDILLRGLLATEILDGEVFNGANPSEQLGQIENLIISREGVVTAVVLEVEGFLGIGGHKVAIPLQQFRQIGGHMVLPDASKEILRQLPAFDLKR